MDAEPEDALDTWGSEVGSRLPELGHTIEPSTTQEQNEWQDHEKLTEVNHVNCADLKEMDCHPGATNGFNTADSELVLPDETPTEPSVAGETESDEITVPQDVAAPANDPALFAKGRIVSSTISFLINSPCQPGNDFKFESYKNRHFLPAWFSRTLPDGKCKKRHWLSYSPSTNAAYCVDCMLFGGHTADVTWARDGYTGWIHGHGLRGITTHEIQKEHKEAELSRFQWLHNQRIDQQLSEQNTLLVEQNRRVVVVAVKAIKYLAKEMMALRGHESNSGKFLHLFSLLAEFDPSASAYLEKLSSIRNRETRKKPEVNFLSPINIRRLLKSMKVLVVKRIREAIEQQGAFSLICDGTQDASKLEAEAILVRYIEVHNGRLRPTERLIDVFTTGDTSGEALCAKIVAILTSHGIDINCMIGQSYDGAGNMRGQFSGLKTRILEHVKQAVYVWCRSHRLNLVIESMLKCSTDVVGTIGLVQELYNFFAGHKRHAVLVELQKDEHHRKTLKRVSDTTRSWRSTEDGVNTLLDCFEAVTAALGELSTTSGDSATVNSALSLEKRLQEFPIIVCLFLLRTVFGITGPVSRLLQGVAADLAISATLIQGAIKSLQDMRDSPDLAWLKLLQDATSFAVKHDISPVFKEKRVKKVKRMPGELAQDEPIERGEQAFKCKVFIPVLDTVLVQLKERFTDHDTELMTQMQVFAPSALLTSERALVDDDVHNLCTNYSLDTSVVLKELREFRPVYRQVHSMVNMDDLMPEQSNSYPARSRDMSLTSSKAAPDSAEQNKHADDPVPNEPREEEEVEEHEEEQSARASWIEQSFTKPLRVLGELSGFDSLSCMYRNLASLAVTSCSAERAMSRVKIVKDRLRSTMLDDWFSALLVLSMEKDMLDSINDNDIVDQFASCSEPLQKQLMHSFHV